MGWDGPGTGGFVDMDSEPAAGSINSPDLPPTYEVRSAARRQAGPTGPEWTAKGKPKKINTKPDLGIADDDVELHTPVKAAYLQRCRQAGVRPTNQGFRKFVNEAKARDMYSPDPELAGKHMKPEDAPSYNEYQWELRGKKPKNLESGGGKHEGLSPMEYFMTASRDMYSPDPDLAGKHMKPEDAPSYNEYQWELRGKKPKNLESGGGKHEGLSPMEYFMTASRRTAAPDYLQKADEALTNLLNQKAEEFQQGIAPLQQALQTVQQAEQEAQAANPLNVMPPAGTVNVLPESPQGAGGDPSGGGGMDPNALAALMGGGGDPSMGGGDPAMGGGAPPGLDPGAMGGAPPAAAGQGALPPELMGGQQQMMARRRTAGDSVHQRWKKNEVKREERFKSSFDNPGWDNLTSHPDFEGSGWKPYDIDFLRREYKTPEKAQKMITKSRQFNDKVNAAATGASLADIGREHGVHPATLRDYSDLGNYTNYFDAPLKPRHEWIARGVAQKHWPKKPTVDYSDPSSAQVGLTVARRGKGRGASSPRTAKNVDQLWEEYSHQTTLRGGEPDVDTFAEKYRVGPRAIQRIRQKAMGG